MIYILYLDIAFINRVHKMFISKNIALNKYETYLNNKHVCYLILFTVYQTKLS